MSAKAKKRSCTTTKSKIARSVVYSVGNSVRDNDSSWHTHARKKKGVAVVKYIFQKTSVYSVSPRVFFIYWTIIGQGAAVTSFFFVLNTSSPFFQQIKTGREKRVPEEQHMWERNSLLDRVISKAPSFPAPNSHCDTQTRDFEIMSIVIFFMKKAIPPKRFSINVAIVQDGRFNESTSRTLREQTKKRYEWRSSQLIGFNELSMVFRVYVKLLDIYRWAVNVSFLVSRI